MDELFVPELNRIRFRTVVLSPSKKEEPKKRNKKVPISRNKETYACFTQYLRNFAKEQFLKNIKARNNQIMTRKNRVSNSFKKLKKHASQRTIQNISLKKLKKQRKSILYSHEKRPIGEMECFNTYKNSGINKFFKPKIDTRIKYEFKPIKLSKKAMSRPKDSSDRISKFHENGKINKKLGALVQSRTFLDVMKRVDDKFRNTTRSKFKENKSDCYYCKNPDLFSFGHNPWSLKSRFSTTTSLESCIFCEKEPPFQEDATKARRCRSQEDIVCFDIEKETRNFDYNEIAAKVGLPRKIRQKYNLR
ncbi:unnamed protein product [Moneuplotes crassus]|uniref:Uncharacterized protein n=1 Tax=Euplotes crassus TaxID=5936 RepID=A0AAD1UQ57_EUPCR|nr:unnamed protein product [Moneuplotes crassus]